MKSEKQNPVLVRKQGQYLKQRHDINVKAQCTRLLEWLREKPITTLEARLHLDILAPAARTYELRHNYGFNIVTDWCEEITPIGIKHKVAKYYLMPGKFKENNHG